MTLANIVTLARLLLIPVIVVLLFRGFPEASFALTVLVLAGDLLDGALARSQHQVSELGKLLDPIADKLLFAALVLSFALKGMIPWLAFVLLALPPVGLLVGAALLTGQRRPLLASRFLGKLSSFLMSGGLLMVFADLLWNWAPWPRLSQYVLYAGIALSYAAAVDYLLVGWQQIKGARERGIPAAGVR